MAGKPLGCRAVFSKQGLRDRPPSMAKCGVSAVEGKSRETEEGVAWRALWPHITFPPFSPPARTWSRGPNQNAREAGKQGLPCVPVSAMLCFKVVVVFFFFSITNNNSANVFCYLSLGHFYQISRIRIAGSKDIDISFLMPNFSVTLDVLILVAGSLPKKIVIIYIFTKNI